MAVISISELSVLARLGWQLGPVHPLLLWGAGTLRWGVVQSRGLLFTSVICWDTALHSGCPAQGKDPLG